MMRGRIRTLFGAFAFAALAATAAIGQSQPQSGSDLTLKAPVQVAMIAATASASPAPGVAPVRRAPIALPSAQIRRVMPRLLPPSQMSNGTGLNSMLGPKMPLSMFPALPPKTTGNTAWPGGVRRRMSGTATSEMYNTVSGCSSTLGYIFNVGCTIDFQLSYCQPNNGNANCSGSGGTTAITSITTTDTFQDYYIDANSGTVQSIGSTYVPNALGASLPSDCTNQTSCTYGPFHNLTLNNSGVVVLATLDCGTSAAGCGASPTATKWVASVYVQVNASSNALETYSDTTRLTPQSQFSIPTGVNTNTIYMSLTGAQYHHSYVLYIEDTATYTTCTGYIPSAAGANGLCAPSSQTGYVALSSGTINTLQWTFGSGTNWTALTTGSYTIVAYDQTSGTSVAQTQVSLQATGSGSVSLTALGGNPSPNPQPASTAGTRFAFDNTSDASDIDIYQAYSGLTNGHKYCFSFVDPEGRVYSDFVTPQEKFTCQAATGSTFNVTHGNINAETPLNFAPNTYTVEACDYNVPAPNGAPCTVVASEAFQLLGYNAITQFTDSAGTTVLGSSLVVPKNSSVTDGLEFINDGDSYYGTGNGDTLSALYYSTLTTTGGKYGITINFSCGTTCTQTVTDSNGQTWYAYLQQFGGGVNAYSTITVCPQAWGTTCSSNSGSQSLAMNASITLTNVTYVSGPGSATCTGGNCNAITSILPADGLTWSVGGSTAAGDLTYFTNSNGNTYAATGTFAHLGVVSGCSGSSCSAFSGTVTAPCTVSQSGNAYKLQQGFYTNFQQGLYSAAEPFSPTTGQGDVYCVKFTNNSTSGTITGISFQLPSGYATGSYSTTWSVDTNSPTKWQQDTTSGLCPASANFCIKPSSPNTGIAIGSSQIVYLDVQNLPPLSFNYAEVTENVYNPVGYSATADSCCSQTEVVSATAPTQTTVDALALGAYSLDSTWMTPLFNPTSEGTSTNNTVNISLKNTSTAQDTNPDYVDAIVFEFSGSGILGAPSGINTNWLYLGSNTPGVGGGSTIDYWFGLCNAQFSTANGPQSSPTTANAKSLPHVGGTGCSATTEQSALSPGSSFSFNATVQTSASAGTIPMTVYAHGANGNGWSKSNTTSLTVTSVSATAGYANAGQYGAPPAVSSNTTPQIGPDTSTTFGNSFIYKITNTSGTGHNITSAQILIPYEDSSGANGADSAGFIWKVTATPTVSGGSGYTNCGVTSYTNPTAGSANGYITIGNSGGTCTITPNGYIDVSFSMQAPYKVNDQYQFPTCINGTYAVATCSGVSAAEAWVGDTYIQTVLGATLSITVDATSNVHGQLFTPVCASCVYTQATNTIDMGFGLSAGNTYTGTDVALIDLYTNAANPIGWDIYVTQSATDTTAGGYLQLAQDSTYSYQPQTGVTLNYQSPTYGVIPITGSYASGLHIATTSSGTTATRNPFEFVHDYRIAIPAAGDTGPNTSTLTYTFIAQ